MQEQVSLLIHRDKAVVVSEMCDEDQDKQRGLMKELIKLMKIQLKKMDPPPHLYHQKSQLLKANAFLLKQGTLVRSHRGWPCGITSVTVEKT